MLIDDNTWTTPLRDGNGGGAGWKRVEIDVADGGEWLAVEFNMGEGGGGDSGVVYWDYNPDAPEGDRLGGQERISRHCRRSDRPQAMREMMYIPDTHLRLDFARLISADLVGQSTDSVLGYEFDIDGDTDTADRL